MKGIVFGAGFLGTRIAEELEYRAVPIEELDVLDKKNLALFLDTEKPDVIVNAVGQTDLDWCEMHPAETRLANVDAAVNLASESRKRDIFMMHIGTGCIYHGDNNGEGYKEEDIPNFKGVYAESKIEAENALREFPCLQVRIRLPIDKKPHAKNLISKILRYNKALDMQDSMTSVPSMIYACKILIEKKRKGIYNCVNPGTISIAEIMELYKKIINPCLEFEIIRELAGRERAHCSLNTDKLRSEGIELPEIHMAVVECLREYKKYV